MRLQSAVTHRRRRRLWSSSAGAGRFCRSKTQTAVATRIGMQVRTVLKKARKLKLEAREDRTRAAIARLKRTDSTMRIWLRVNDKVSKTRTTKSERSSHRSQGRARRA